MIGNSRRLSLPCVRKLGYVLLEGGRFKDKH